MERRDWCVSTVMITVYPALWEEPRRSRCLIVRLPIVMREDSAGAKRYRGRRSWLLEKMNVDEYLGGRRREKMRPRVGRSSKSRGLLLLVLLRLLDILLVAI